MDNNNNQRIDSKSNADVGRLFELKAKEYLEKHFKTELISNRSVHIGVSKQKKGHKFDLGNDKILIECKSHRWTAGQNVPSAKLTVWKEAMYLFHLVEGQYRKIFFVEKHIRKTNHESLATYFERTYSHLIPEDFEIWEFDEIKGVYYPVPFLPKENA